MYAGKKLLHRGFHAIKQETEDAAWSRRSLNGRLDGLRWQNSLHNLMRKIPQNMPPTGGYRIPIMHLRQTKWLLGADQ